MFSRNIHLWFDDLASDIRGSDSVVIGIFFWVACFKVELRLKIIKNLAIDYIYKWLDLHLNLCADDFC